MQVPPCGETRGICRLGNRVWGLEFGVWSLGFGVVSSAHVSVLEFLPTECRRVKVADE